jgi:hypothetical protein
LGGGRTGVSGESRNDEEIGGQVFAWGGVEGKLPGVALEVSERELKIPSAEIRGSVGAVEGCPMVVVLRALNMVGEMDGSNGEEGRETA